MSNSAIRRMAEQLYDAGRALFQAGQYNEALLELRRAEDAFRRWDAQGHPFTDRLPSGMTGLAETLALSGLCYQKLGNFKAALTCYETSLINSKFERRSALRSFTHTLAENLITCYEKTIEDTSLNRESFLNQEPEIDVSYRFPHSLPPGIIPFARLYELAPDRYLRYQDFYRRAKQRDESIRLMLKTSDESTMKRASIYVWGILVAIWIAYGLIVVNALFHKR